MVLFLAALLTAPLAGCGEARETGPRGVRAVELDTVEGVPVVRNPEEPLFPRSEVRVSELWSRSLDDLLGERRSWDRAPSVEIGGQPRTLIVLAPNAGRILVVDPESGRTRSVVEPSDPGGGRLDEPIGLAVLEDRVFVGERHGIEVFGLGGGHLERIDLPVEDSQLDRALQLHRLDSASVLSLAALSGTPVWRRFEVDGDRVEVPPPHAISRQYPTATERRCWRVAAGSRGPLLGSCFFPVVVELDSAGSVRREIVIEGGADSASGTQLDRLRRESRARWRAWNDELSAEGLEARVERDLRLHAILDQYRGVREDPETGLISVLAETPEYLGGGEASIHLFSGAGVYLARIGFPEYWLHHDIRSSVLYAVTRDDAGTHRMRAYRLELPLSALEASPGPETPGRRAGADGS